MAELFQASLLDQNGNVGIVRNGDNIIIKDYSNYLTNEDYDAYFEYFTVFKKIRITSFTGKEYLFSSLGDGDALISVPTDEFPNFPSLENKSKLFFNFLDSFINLFKLTSDNLG